PRLTRIDRQAAANGVCNCTRKVRRFSSAVATSREGHRSPGSGRAARRRRSDLVSAPGLSPCPSIRPDSPAAAARGEEPRAAIGAAGGGGRVGTVSSWGRGAAGRWRMTGDSGADRDGRLGGVVTPTTAEATEVLAVSNTDIVVGRSTLSGTDTGEPTLAV